MDVFDLRNQLVSEYESYISSFIRIRDQKIRDFVDEKLDQGLLWPDPLIQLNPSFSPGKWVDELVEEGLLHNECKKIFRIKNDDGRDERLRLHKHQEDAIRVADTGANYVLTTGTGSGKSLAYIIPIVNHVLKRGSGKGIQAIIVYPMNALANSQLGELDKFINLGYPNRQGKIRFKRFTGQESDEEKNLIRQSPPDILLTNYVMLELLLTRPEDRNSIIRHAEGLQFLVLDELHTYRGRQGSDVAMLIRRVRDAVDSYHLQCVGTSATLAGAGSYQEQKDEVARVASIFFGDEVKPENVIGETLKRVSEEKSFDTPSEIEGIKKRIQAPKSIPENYASFMEEPLSCWIESTFGITREEESGRLVRATPISITGAQGAARKLAELTGEDVDSCKDAIENGLMMGYRVTNPDTSFPVFAFRIHQFISPGDTVYATLEPSQERYITVNNQQFKPGDREKVLLPVVFCRECGQEYYSVRISEDPETNQNRYLPREYTDYLRHEEDRPAYLYLNPENPWPKTLDEIIERLPDEWLEFHPDGLRIRRTRRKDLPEHIRVTTAGAEKGAGNEMVLINAPFRFCLNCGVAYSFSLRSDYTKLSNLSTGGRSTSTTILSLTTIRQLRREGYLDQEARKLLSFTDNRQDASLQSGHFNDFVETGLLRAALYQAIRVTGENGLRHDELTQQVFDHLDLPIELYASDPEVRFAARQETEQVLRDVLGYRLYRDLRRGWRVTSPNLEQCGLLKIDYLSLGDLCAAEEEWKDTHLALATASSETRARVSKTLLDFMRRELSIQVQYLNKQEQDRIRQRSGQRLITPWALDENEVMESARVLYPRPRRPSDYGGNVYLSARGGYGQYLNRRDTFENYDPNLGMTEREQIICDLLNALRIAGIVEVVDNQEENGETSGYQLKAAALIWKTDDGTKAFHDPIRVPSLPGDGGQTNPFFVNFYKTVFEDLKGLHAREHTAQVSYEEREKREDGFREGRLPILYCSPTMELGIDIAQLNVVNMRNVPPTPANYAQRSGRAGRSGQPALIFTYCSKGSPHDQYFFKRPERMVSGAVTPPRLELANDDLIRAHLQAIWLSETGQKLGVSLKDILDLSGDPPSLALIEEIQVVLEDKGAIRRAGRRAQKILESMGDVLVGSDWYNEDWLSQVFQQIAPRFEQACERWRDLYRAALRQREQQDAIIRDASRTHQERNRARNLRREAENQLELLLDSRNIIQSDFYIYRYFASEGFLPGYNFPRLPLSAYIPARRVRTDQGDYLSRPRFLAISEFGPRSRVYHEGSTYIINRVIMQVARAEEEDESLATNRIKLCPICGYLHQIHEGDGLDLCERCTAPLPQTLTSLFRMQNVSTRRRARINSDEEERFRLGYDIRTSLRFHQDDGYLHVQTGELSLNGEVLAKLSYGPSATIWRINLGWRRRQNQEQHGFVIDIEHGYWQRNDAVEDDPEDPMSARVQRVIPYVEDRKNCLLFEPTELFDHAVMASLTAALKTAIQVEYQLEDNELAVAPLPDENDRRLLLFFEAAEGGAGVLRQLVQEPGAFSRVARQALEICHYNPESGEDYRHAPQSEEDCEAACYDCLMSYYNQRDHLLLDRTLIRDQLLDYRNAVVETSPVASGRDEHFQQLKNLCQSVLEEKWLEYLFEKGYRLPSKAQVLMSDCQTRPDFTYENEFVVVYIDGYHHLDEKRQQRDTQQQSCLEDLGYTVLRFGLLDDWPKIIAENEYLFGKTT